MGHKYIISIILFFIAFTVDGQRNFIYNQHYKLSAPANTVPVVTTQSVTNINNTTVTVNGIVVSNGGLPIESRGVSLSTNSNDIKNLWDIPPSYIDDNYIVGSFSGNVTELSANTTYYYQAWALNSLGFGWGEIYSFTTPAFANIPVVVLDSIGIRYGVDKAYFYGNVTSQGSSSVTERGFVYSEFDNPTIQSATKVIVGSGLGTYNNLVQNLSCGVTYYVRAYAINSVGVAYSSTQTFILDAINLPIVSIYSYIRNRCIELGTKNSLEDAKAAIDLYRLPLIEGCNRGGSGYSARIYQISIGERFYSYSGCGISPSRGGYYVIWSTISSPTTTIVYIDNNAYITEIHYY